MTQHEHPYKVTREFSASRTSGVQQITNGDSTRLDQLPTVPMAVMPSPVNMFSDTEVGHRVVSIHPALDARGEPIWSHEGNPDDLATWKTQHHIPIVAAYNRPPSEAPVLHQPGAGATGRADVYPDQRQR